VLCVCVSVVCVCVSVCVCVCLSVCPHGTTRLALKKVADAAAVTQLQIHLTV